MKLRLNNIGSYIVNMYRINRILLLGAKNRIPLEKPLYPSFSERYKVSLKYAKSGPKKPYLRMSNTEP